MAEAFGGALLSAVLEVLIDRLASPAISNLFRKNQLVTELLEKLRITLWSANALLNDAEDKQVRDKNVKSWVDELNQVLNKADDVMDEINTEALRREVEARQQSRFHSGRILSKLVPNNPFNAFGMQKKIQKLIDSLKFLLDQKDFLGLKEGVQSRKIKRVSAPLIQDPSDVYGRNNDKRVIKEFVLSENVIVGGEKISVIPIVGMGGVGKTTLARFVYNDSNVKSYFEHRTWVTVSDNFDVFGLAKQVFEGLSSEKCDVWELDELREKIESFLSGKKFLLVLDDVWNENYNHWNAFKSYFQFGANGSKIIVTTRNEAIGSKMGSVPFHPLQTMSDEDCWQLFTKHAFHNVEISVYQELEEVGRRIVNKCKGLPLAVMSLAGLLCSVTDPREWRNILKSDVWELQKKGDNEILPSLWLSYSYLPSHLKRCFTYCSIFPKGYTYDKEKIVSLWMAEGLLEGENMEELGDEYFKILISQSLFQRSSKDDSTLLMHDLVHDLATFVSGKEFCVKLGYKNSNLQSMTSKTSHLLYWKTLPDLKDFKGGLPRAKCLRTFLSVAPPVPSYFRDQIDLRVKFDVLVKKFKCMRVLCLADYSIEKVPDSIGDLTHLRYLDFSRTSIRTLPDTICSLYNLQTLLLSQCEYLTNLPAKMERLTNLMHLDISGTHSLKKMPQHIGNLKALRSLTKFILDDKHSSRSLIRELTELPHLRGRLEVSGLEHIVDIQDALDLGFKNRTVFTDLKFTWCGYSESNNDKQILDALEPRVSLEILSIKGYRGMEFSEWVANNSFSNTTIVYLINCMECKILPPFGQLPMLKELTIAGLCSVEAIGSEFYGSENTTTTIPFRSLKSIGFIDMSRLRSWSFNGANKAESVPFPSLKDLYLNTCPVLNSHLPHRLLSLKCLFLFKCLKMESLVPRDQHLMATFPSVERIVLRKCPDLEFAGWPLPSTVDSLSISHCGKLFSQRTQWSLRDVKDLRIAGCEDAVDSFPEEGLLPNNLVTFHISDAPGLKALNGKGLAQLPGLKWLSLIECCGLQSLPQQGLPGSLSRLDVYHCPLLKQRLKRDTGEDWHKISHIPKIYIDGIQIR